MIAVHLFNAAGESLGSIEATDGGAIPRVGEWLRITEGDEAGDYSVDFVRWCIPACEVDLKLTPRHEVDTWPSIKRTAEAFEGEHVAHAEDKYDKEDEAGGVFEHCGACGRVGCTGECEEAWNLHEKGQED